MKQPEKKSAKPTRATTKHGLREINGATWLELPIALCRGLSRTRNGTIPANRCLAKVSEKASPRARKNSIRRTKNTPAFQSAIIQARKANT
jgi:hypothetical protein